MNYHEYSEEVSMQFWVLFTGWNKFKIIWSLAVIFPKKKKTEKN